ncbi:TRAP-type C4-dicarboxylate transport system, small permease component [Albimonas donghaensis]|uniref:TRAP transporter small permease protein n=1 Tax=Albimonas donghaensis TaxID=356660 RepID=A0A1H3AWD2_9RHOB|nr:TRAP transporter small permease [Albimonas donghaensis]SDX33701.1 TRAP-type C4-dicarboxylate transport system, small permease component [Albimonas donghaensis]
MTTVFGLLDRAALWLARIGAGGALLALGAMMIHICADAFSRWLFSAPIAGTLEIVAHYYMTAVVFLPLALVQRAREHITVDVFSQLLPASWVRVCDRIALVLTLLLTGAFTVAAFQQALRETSKNAYLDVIFFDLSIWETFWVMAAGAFFVALAALVGLIAELTGWRERGVNRDHHDLGESHP